MSVENGLLALAGFDPATLSRDFRTRLHPLVEAADERGPLLEECCGAYNHRLLRFCTMLTVERSKVSSQCSACRESMDVEIFVTKLLETRAGDRNAEVSVGASIFRLPRMADLGAIESGPDAEPIILQLARICRIRGLEPIGEDLVDALSSAFDTADPAAAIKLDHACTQCGHRALVSVQVELLVANAATQASTRLLQDIDAIASAYGWSEPQIMTLPPERRGRYVEIITARIGAR
ncbi:hypothetical protein [Polymorphobacter multimanifer]|uniref:Baseplate protein n=1 Tax=Polymorphobacter multimanifer TaxID=1070431 RepID=A0A841LB26_9SPHN|nr:hypothetical protein [Polymorphobacter multimanifer]MBB6228861.1 hypothetical protein [Polymorphobacter multimanifer]